MTNRLIVEVIGAKAACRELRDRWELRQERASDGRGLTHQMVPRAAGNHSRG